MDKEDKIAQREGMKVNSQPPDHAMQKKINMSYTGPLSASNEQQKSFHNEKSSSCAEIKEERSVENQSMTNIKKRQTRNRGTNTRSNVQNYPHQE